MTLAGAGVAGAAAAPAAVCPEADPLVMSQAGLAGLDDRDDVATAPRHGAATGGAATGSAANASAATGRAANASAATRGAATDETGSNGGRAVTGGRLVPVAGHIVDAGGDERGGAERVGGRP